MAKRIRVDDIDEGNGHQFSNTAIITVLITVGLAVLAAFWALSDPRTEIRTIRDTYLTLREHSEFQQRIARDVARLEAEQLTQPSRIEITAILTERNKLIDKLVIDVESLRRELIKHPDREEMVSLFEERAKALAILSSQIENVRKDLQAHERDERGFLLRQPIQVELPKTK